MQNFDLQRELAERSEKDWVFGSTSEPGLVFIPQAERAEWLPLGEQQFDAYGDFNDCASRSPVNHMEALFTYHYNHAMKPENKKWLEDNGYTQDGKVTFSDRYIAVLSGTTRQGNSLKAPLEAIRTQGLIPKRLLPKTDTMTWQEYYAPVSQANKDLGAQFLTRFSVNYEQVPQAQIGDLLTTDMVGVAGYAWAQPVNGIYPTQPASMGFNHAFLIYTLPKYKIFDNYIDFSGGYTKDLAPDYTFFDYGYRIYISAENAPKHLFLKNLTFGVTDPEVTWLQQALVSRGYAIPDAVTAYFGVETKQALFKFQNDNHITDDGSHFGPLTRLALNTSPSQGAFNDLLVTVRTFLGI